MIRVRRRADGPNWMKSAALVASLTFDPGRSWPRSLWSARKRPDVRSYTARPVREPANPDRAIIRSMWASRLAAPAVGGATARTTAHTRRARRTVTERLRPPSASGSYLDGLNSSCTA